MNQTLELQLVRRWMSPKSTIGELSIDGAFECFTLEDLYRPDGMKVPGKTAIPCGRYEVEISFSPRFQRFMPHVKDVPGFEGIRIHTGNTPDDTEGCILVGRARMVDVILNSREAYAALFDKLQAASHRGDRIFLTVSVAGETNIC